MALAGAEQGFHAGLERDELIIRHKGLNGACKAAAVDADRAGALEQLTSCLLYTSRL